MYCKYDRKKPFTQIFFVKNSESMNPNAKPPRMRLQKITSLFLLAGMLAACSSSKKGGNSLSDLSGQKPTYEHLFSDAYQPLLNENTYQLDSISTDENYSFTTQHPVMVGGSFESGALNERRFLNALLSPDGQEISYARRGSCCAFVSPNGFMGGGRLDIYDITMPGAGKPVVIYINMYDRGALKAPKGFTFRRN